MMFAPAFSSAGNNFAVVSKSGYPAGTNGISAICFLARSCENVSELERGIDADHRSASIFPPVTLVTARRDNDRERPQTTAPREKRLRPAKNARPATNERATFESLRLGHGNRSSRIAPPDAKSPTTPPILFITPEASWPSHRRKS